MSTDGGSVWSEIDSDYFTDGGDMISDPTNGSVYWTTGRTYTGSSYVMAASKTTNSGSTWTRYEIGTGSGMAYCMAMDPDDPDVVYIGGYESSAPAIYMTANGGGSWSKLTGSGLGGWVYDLAIDPLDTSLIYAATSQGMYRSTDGGSSWTEIGGFGGCEEILLHPNDNQTIYLGTSNSGVWLSYDGGDSWQEMNDGLSESSVPALAIHDGEYAFAGTEGGAVYRYDLDVGAEGETGSPIPSTELYAAPNPAAGSTVIHYQLDCATQVRLDIYDLTGRLVCRMVDGFQSPGEHSVLWNGSDDAGIPAGPGIYFTRLQTDTDVVNGKVILTD